MKTLKKGSKGIETKILQTYLDIEEDGFGDLTDKAVKAYQSKNGLLADGVVGMKTWLKLIGLKKTTRPVHAIFLHCSATKEGQDVTVDTIRKWHKAQGWSDVGYHYIIYRDGTVHEGRSVDKVGSHCAGYNTGTIGICYIGGVDTNNRPKDTRTIEQKKAMVMLVSKLMILYDVPLREVHCHNEYANKACPSFDRSKFLSEFHTVFGYRY